MTAELSYKELFYIVSSVAIIYLFGVIYLWERIDKLQSILFTIGEIAVSDWNNIIVGLVDKTLPKGFRITKEKHFKNLSILKQSKENKDVSTKGKK